MGYNYKIVNGQGKKNVAADGLSRVYGAQLMALTLSTVNSDLMNYIKGS